MLLVSTYNADLDIPCLATRLFKDITIDNVITLATFHGHDKIEAWLTGYKSRYQHKLAAKNEEMIAQNTFYFTTVWCISMLVTGFWLVQQIQMKS